MATIRTLTQVKSDREFEPDRRPLQLSLFRRMFTYSGPYKDHLTKLLISVGLRAAQGPAMIWAMAAVINGPIAQGRTDLLWWGVAGYAAIALFTFVTLYFRLYHAHMLGEGVVHDLRDHLFRKLQTLTMSFFHQMKVGRIISRMASDAEAMRAGVENAVFVAMVNVGTIICSAAVMLWIDPTLFCFVLMMSPIYYLAYHYFRRRMSDAQRAAQESFSRLTGTLAESVAGIRVTQGFVRQDVNAEMFSELVLDHSGYNLGYSRAAGRFTPILELLGQLTTALIFVVGGRRVLNADPVTLAALGTLTTFYYQSTNVLSPVAALGNQYNNAVTAMAGAERVFKLLDREPEFIDPPDAVHVDIRGRVEFRDLTFGYDPAKPVLHEVNFTAQPGQTVALVGHTGSGKSSIINLISKFYLPTKGELLIDGVEVRRIRSDSLHSQMGIVLQSNFLFTGTVMDNIRVGRRSATEEEVVEVARRLDCLDMIESLPDGFKTVVGERGVGLSLGQRQLVCFARAMLADPKIMILDEATSSVDTLTEARIQKALSILLRGRTSFVVAHRLSTIRHADVVLVLDHGRIVERGNHEDLLATGGVYANLYLQFIRASEA